MFRPNLRTLLPIAAVAGLGYVLLKKSTPGSKAQVGDDVFVAVDPTSPAAPLLPAGAFQVMVHVTGTAGSDVLTGTVAGAVVTAGSFVPVPGGTPASVNRSSVIAVMRGGKTVA